MVPPFSQQWQRTAKTVKTVRVFVSFFLTTESEQGSIHKEKKYVPISAEHHKELNSFERHLRCLRDFMGVALRYSAKERFGKKL